MTSNQFEQFWKETYALTPPIPHLFKRAYSTRWLRVHSLPEAKRYPDNDLEWSILLDRQKSFLTDLLGSEDSILLVTGEYFNPTSPLIFSPHPCLHHLSFTKLSPIALAMIDGNEEYDPGERYQPFCAPVDGSIVTNESLLQDIANDELRVFFVSFEHDLLIAPYDGGVDIIFKDEVTKDHYKTKYKNWVSSRRDGL